MPPAETVEKRMTKATVQIDELCVNTLRFLAVDAVESARSGHPGLPLGAAPMAYALWDRLLRHNPKNAGWFNRDRFVLSAGHGSALLYALLHAFRYDLPLSELQNFRQWGSKTPGHPEYGDTPGVEVTTGPLGQGFANGVGMAIAEKFLAAAYNRDGFPIVDHFTYAIVSDGDLMEGVASEAASLAGHLALGKLIYFYDDNQISLAGATAISFTEDVEPRFNAYGWNTIRVSDGNDLDGIEAAIKSAQAEIERPTLMMIRSHIGFGSPKQDTHGAHGEALGPDDTISTKKFLKWPVDKPFHFPEEAIAHFEETAERGASHEAAWNQQQRRYADAHPDLAAEFGRVMRGDLPEDWRADLPVFGADDGQIATRDASGKAMNGLANRIPHLVGGSADLAPSTKTLLTRFSDFRPSNSHGRNIRFGVREHAMGAIVNGMAVHGGLIPYGATFLVFSDYMRPAIRLAALMQAHSVFVFTHDSIAMGEDGPTHQPVEHLAALRSIPGLTVLRPADANETVAAWEIAVARNGPVALVFTRQGVPVLDSETYAIGDGVPRGAYILTDADNRDPGIVLVASGSEVHLAMDARAALVERGVDARVVSMPSWELFDEQTASYREQVLPPGVPTLAIEAAHPMGWHRYLGGNGAVMGIERFGASAPGAEVYANLGFTVEKVVERALELVDP